MVSYQDKYEVVTDVKKFDLIIGIKTCRPRLMTNKNQLQALQHLHTTQKVQYYYYYADPTLSTDFVVDERNHIVIVKCEDDYLNVSPKFIQFVKFVTKNLQNNNSVRDCIGLFLTDDDTTLYTENLMTFVRERGHIPYWGNVHKHNSPFSYHVQSKVSQSSIIKQQVQTYWPSLQNIPIEVVTGVLTCSGGGFYLNRSTVAALSCLEHYFQPFPKNEEELSAHKCEENGVVFYKDLCPFDDLQVGVALLSIGIQPESVPITEIVVWT
jgi:hypothetical protein